jgi:hypothetical protein
MRNINIEFVALAGRETEAYFTVVSEASKT